MIYLNFLFQDGIIIKHKSSMIIKSEMGFISLNLLLIFSSPHMVIYSIIISYLEYLVQFELLESCTAITAILSSSTNLWQNSGWYLTTLLLLLGRIGRVSWLVFLAQTWLLSSVYKILIELRVVALEKPFKNQVWCVLFNFTFLCHTSVPQHNTTTTMLHSC